MQNDAVFDVRAFTDFDPAEQDAVLHLAFNDAAVGDQRVAGMGVLGVARRRFVFDLRINQILLEEQLAP
ncbi:hypothetical protein D3C79_1099420 [compost metagenome]